MQVHKTLVFGAYLSLLPLVLAVLLALINFFEWPLLTGKTLAFARINSYIYAHSYGVLLICSYSGLQIGMVMEKPQVHFYLWFNFAVILLSWLSFHSFAEMKGLMLLLSCQSAVTVVDHLASKNSLIHPWFASHKLKINMAFISLLTVLILINQ